MATSPMPPSPASTSHEPVLTPSRKIKALLAQCDDSDSEAPDAAPGSVRNASSENERARDEVSSESDADVPIVRKSRMAARLEAPSTTSQVLPASASPRAHTSPPRSTSSYESDPSEALVPRRRLLSKRKSSPVVPDPAGDITPSSPLFFPSPARSHISRSQYVDPQPPSESESQTKSKFKALVDKHRKIRSEKEAAERAKRGSSEVSEAAAPTTKRQRGSSPGDESHESSEGSGAEAAKKMAKAAKPTRKASKKAMEEMKRETQRMSRNMQLAHQAQVKKKITKDSLLARFGYPTAAPASASIVENATASSDVGSGSEGASRHTTPPTSPMQEPIKDVAELEQQTEMELVKEAPSLEEIGLPPPTDLSKGKGKVGEVNLPVLAARTGTELVPEKVDKKARLAELIRSTRRSSAHESDDDLDIVTSKGDFRKYAAFENLPKRKAKEKPSHLALRSLAHLHGKSKDERSSMTTAELQADLRKRARLQARAERDQRIEELRAKGVIVQTAEERDRDQQEVEDLMEKARQEAADISRREKEIAKKDGTFVKDAMDDDESDDEEDMDFAETEDEATGSDNEDEDEEERGEDIDNDAEKLFDDQADEQDSEVDSTEAESEDEAAPGEQSEDNVETPAPRKGRKLVLSDDEDEYVGAETPRLPQPIKTPQMVQLSARKHIPGLPMSDDLALGLTQAFDATMADSQTQADPQEQESVDYVGDLPSPGIGLLPRLNRLESLDMITDSQPATQPLNIDLAVSQHVPESPAMSRQPFATQATPSQVPFEPTQDADNVYSPFQGNRFMSHTPVPPHSTVDTVPLDSPVLQRKVRLQRGRAQGDSGDEEADAPSKRTAFEEMRRAAKSVDKVSFDKSKSNARNVVDEAAEESDDEYAGLGGASDDDGNDIENDDDRRMIDHDTQVGRGDEAALAGFFADRERKSDEAAVTKLYQDITTGKLRRRGVANDDIDLSDEEDANARRREAKRREFARMRRELLKDEAVGKIAEDKKKEAFLRSIEDRQVLSDDELDEPETLEDNSQSQAVDDAVQDAEAATGMKRKRPLEASSDSQLNRLPPALRRDADKKPTTLLQIRESLSFLLEEPDSLPSANFDLSDSDNEPEVYVDLDRHVAAAEADENVDDDSEGLGDFIVDDETDSAKEEDETIFKKPSLPNNSRESAFAHRRSRTNVVNRLSLLRQSSSSSSSTKMAFHSSTASTNFKVPNLLRRATTNSSLSSMSSESTSATGVTVAKTERGHVSEEKQFVRKGMGGRRNAVNYQAGERPAQMKGVVKAKKGRRSGKAVGGFLGEVLGRADTWG